MEYGLDERLPIYSGGLGVLAGDFMRSAHALGLPVVGVGILWEEGYTTQAIGPAGETIDLPTPLDRSPSRQRRRRLSPSPSAATTCRCAIWRVDGLARRAALPARADRERDRWINRRLYGGGKDDRVAQEIVLGVGGVRALQALGLDVDVYHFNEGHALFAGLELMRQARARGLDFDEALGRRCASKSCSPRTRRSTPATRSTTLERLRRLGATLGLTHAQMVRLGGDPFNMTVAALRLSRSANAVAELHGETARQMWRHVDDARAHRRDHQRRRPSRVAGRARARRAIDDGGDAALDAARAALQARAGAPRCARAAASRSTPSS